MINGTQVYNKEYKVNIRSYFNFNFKSQVSPMYSQKKEAAYDNQSFYQDTSRRYIREDSPEGIKARLSANWAKMIELFIQRKELMKKLAQVMMSQHSQRIQQISKAKINELKNEARALKDQNLIIMVQNAQKHINSSKSILKLITQSNTKTLQQDHSKKSKSYYDQIKRIDTDRLLNINKFKSQFQQINKLTDQQRKLFRDIEILEQQKISVLTSKQHDHIKIAQKIQDEIDKNKLILKNNKNNKDKKKRQLAFQIDKIIESTKRHQTIANNRYTEILEMFAGYDSLQQFDTFFASFQLVIKNKLQAKKEDEPIIMEIMRRATWYEKQVQEIQKYVNQENQLFQYLAQAFRKNQTLALLEKTYLNNIPSDRNSLISLINKSQSYRLLLEKLAQQKNKTKWEIQKAHQVLDHFQPILKSINTEQKRKQELKQRIVKIITAKNQLQKLQKKLQNFQFELTNLLLQKQAIAKPMQEAARKGNLQEYKIKMAQLQKIEQQIALFTQTKNDNKFKEESAKINFEIQQINREYSSIIEEILAGEKEMTFFTFLQKLSKRLMLV